MSSFDAFSPGDQTLALVLDEVRRLSERTDSRFNRGRLIENVSFSAGETKRISHGLGKSSVGFLPLNVRTQPCSFRVYLSADLNVDVDPVDWDASSYNSGSHFVFGSTNRFVAPLSARYSFSAVHTFSTNIGTRQSTYLSLIVNSVLYPAVAQESGNGSNDHSKSGKWELELEKGDQVTTHVDTTSTETLAADEAACWFAGHVMGDVWPYLDESVANPADGTIALHSERPLTCDVWVY